MLTLWRYAAKVIAPILLFQLGYVLYSLSPFCLRKQRRSRGWITRSGSHRASLAWIWPHVSLANGTNNTPLSTGSETVTDWYWP